MSKRNKRKSKVNLSFTIDAKQFNKVGKIENIHEHIQEIKRGTGIKKSKKTYSRKQKHKNKSFYFVFFYAFIKTRKRVSLKLTLSLIFF